MGILRSLLPYLSLCALVLAVAGPAGACTVSSAYVSGTFDEAGRFVVSGVVDSKGNALDGASGFVCSEITTADDVSLAASGYGDAVVYVVGDLDFDKRSLHVRSLTTDAETAAACVATARGGAGAKAAGARIGGGCCAAAKGASARAACAKGDGVKGADVKGTACPYSRAATSPSTKATAAAPTEAGNADAEAANRIVFAVSGMTCGGCCSRVEAAVTALELDGIERCDVSLEKATAVVTVAKDRDVDADAIAKAITAAGFPAELKEEGDEEAAATM